jgi:hypothetical protein
MCIEQSEHWQTGYKYLDMELLENRTNERWVKFAKAV